MLPKKPPISSVPRHTLPRAIRAVRAARAMRPTLTVAICNAGAAAESVVVVVVVVVIVFGLCNEH